MKKLIAIAVVFALVMGGVFAETTVSGGVNGTVVLGKGQTTVDDIYTAGSGGLSLKLAGQNEDGKFGGELSFGANINSLSWGGPRTGSSSIAGVNQNTGDNSGDPATINYYAGNSIKEIRANVWWKPIDMLKIRINGGGFDIGKAGTGIYFGDVNFKNYSEATTVESGDSLGLYLEVKPIDGLEFDLAIPFGRTNSTGSDREFKDTYKNFYAKVSYVIPNIGKVQAGFRSNTFTYRNPARIGLAFDLTSITNLTLGFNAITQFPSADVDNTGNVKTSQLEMGLGIGYTMADAFNVKLSLAGKILGKTVNPDGDILAKDDTQFAVGLFPNYTLGGLKAGLGFDVFIRNIGMAGEEAYNNDVGAMVYWQASPQVQYKVGKGTLKTGVAIGTSPAYDSNGWRPANLTNKIQWQIPVRLSFDL